MKRINNLYLTFVFLALAVIASFFTEIKLILTLLLLILLIALYINYKKRVSQELIIAFLLSLIITSYHLYEYNNFNIFIGRINLFPLVSWTFGLVILREIYEKFTMKGKLLVASSLYLLILFLVEYTGYHILNIQLKTNFPSLIGLGIIHAPLYMKIFYILTGPIFLAITDYLKVK